MLSGCDPHQGTSAFSTPVFRSNQAAPAAHWFALVVRPRHEKTASEYLRNRGFQALSPMYRARRNWSDRVKEIDLPLFTGYVFCNCTYDSRIHVLSSPGVRSMVSFGRGPYPVPDQEIQAIQAILDSGLPVRPWPYLRVGQNVKVVRGCLAGMSGALVREKDAYRVVVNVEMLERSVAVEVEREAISPVDSTVTARPGR
jgi:transcription antitermination factor NusG